MRTASRVFYLLTGILSLVAVALLLTFGILGLTGNLADAFKGEDLEPEVITASFITMLVYAGFELVAAFIGFHGNKLSKKGSPRKGFHIFCIVIAVIFWNPFLFLAGLFGLIGASLR